jgi:type I restriction-modification system, R subunit
MSDTFDKKELSEMDIRTKYITPAIESAGWDKLSQLREEYAVTKGRIIARVEELLKICDELK